MINTSIAYRLFLNLESNLWIFCRIVIYKDKWFIKCFNKIYAFCQIAYKRGNSLLNASVTHILSDPGNIVLKGANFEHESLQYLRVFTPSRCHNNMKYDWNMILHKCILVFQSILKSVINSEVIVRRANDTTSCVLV